MFQSWVEASCRRSAEVNVDVVSADEAHCWTSGSAGGSSALCWHIYWEVLHAGGGCWGKNMEAHGEPFSFLVYKFLSDLFLKCSHTILFLQTEEEYSFVNNTEVQQDWSFFVPPNSLDGLVNVGFCSLLLCQMFLNPVLHLDLSEKLTISSVSTLRCIQKRMPNMLTD